MGGLVPKVAGLFCLMAVGLSACSKEHPAHGNLNSILWVQRSGEYEALALAVYRQAREQLDRALADTAWTAALEQTGEFSTLPPAIITDVDETVLSNAPYRARLVKDGVKGRLWLWRGWVEEAQAPAVPGALEFCQYAASRGVTVFYVTNRRKKIEKSTHKNLEALGFPMKEGVDVILTKEEEEDWVSNKRARRTKLAGRYRILLMLGDALHDFITDSREASNPERIAMTRKYGDYWGSKWFLVPNPMEGVWEQATYDFDTKTTPQERRAAKVSALDVSR